MTQLGPLPIAVETLTVYDGICVSHRDIFSPAMTIPSGQIWLRGGIA